MAEFYDQGASDSYDAADTSTEADTSLRPVDENGQESWAEDQEPLTRGEYADQVRQADPATENDDSAAQDHDDSDQRADTDDDQEQEGLPEPRTRQEVAEEADNVGSDVPDHDQADSAGLDAAIAEDGDLPEPRTRQEVADEARSGTDPLAHDSDNVQQHERDADDQPSADEQARLHQTYLDWRSEITAGRELGTNVVGDKPDRSPGDISDLPPTGEQLLTVEKDDASRAEKFRVELTREYEDVIDATSKNVTSVEQIMMRPQPTGQPVTEVPQVPQIRPETPQQGTLDAGTIAETGLVVGMVLFQAGRWVGHKVNEWKGR